MCPRAHRDLLKMNFTEYNVFSEISNNENENVLSENIIYIGACIGFVFASCVLLVRIIFKPKDKDKDEKITEVTV